MLYQCVSDGVGVDIEADSPREAAEKYVHGGRWNEADRTFFVTVYVAPVGEPDPCPIKVTVHPDEPPCPDGDEHDWEDGPVFGSGGGVRYRDTCRRCGLARVTDTWGTDPYDGTQGHQTVRYESPE